MGAVFTASTSAIAPSERIGFWNAGSRKLGGVKAVALSDVFDAEITSRQIEEVSVFSLRSTPHRVTANALGCSPVEQTPLRLRYQQRGKSTIIQGRRTCELHVGDWTVIDPRFPHTAINEGDASHLWLQIPCGKLSAAETGAARSLDGPLPMSGRISGTLKDCMRYSLETREELSCSSERELVGLVIDLFRAALAERKQDFTPKAARQETAWRIRAYIDSNLQDPELSVDRIAKAIGCTPRYVHKVFEGEESVSRYIWNRRLDLCRQQLEVQSRKSMTLTALAFDHGFNSSSHFSRSFRDRFGTSPSTYLARLQERVEA